MRGLLLTLHLLCPLLFFTDRTRNPYAVQGLLLQAALSAALLWELLRAARRGAWVRRPTVLDAPAAAAVAAALLSWAAAWALHPDLRPSVFHEGLRGHLFLFANMLLPFAFGARYGAPEDPAFRRAALAAGAVAAAYALLQYFGVEPVWDKALNPYNGRPVSTFGNPNFLSSYLVMLLPLALLEFLSARPSARAAWGALTLLSGAALIATMTRSSWIGGAVSVGVFLWGAAPKDRGRARALAALLALLAAATLFWPGSPLSAGRDAPLGRLAELARGIAGEAVYGSWHQRLLIWSCARDMLASSPLTGAGWGLFELFYPFRQAAYLADPVFGGFRTHANNAHNLVLEVASQAGLVGLAAAGWGAVRLARSLRRAAPLSPAAWASAAAVLGMVADNVFGNVSLFFAVPGFLFMWLLGGLAAARAAPAAEISLRRPGPLAAAAGAALLAAGTLLWNVRAWAAETAYFAGFKRAQAGDLGGAERALERSRAWRRHEVNNAYELGNVFLAQARRAAEAGLDVESRARGERAVAAFDDAIAANAGYDELHFNRAAALLLLGRADEAAASLRLSLRINPTHAEGYRLLGSLYARDPAKAEEQAALMAEAARYFPRTAVFWEALGRARLALKDPAGAVEPLARALALDPDRPGLAADLRGAAASSGRPLPPAAEIPRIMAEVRALGGAGQWRRALEKAAALADLAPEWPLTWLILGDLRAQTNAPAEAVAAYDRCLALDPRHKVARLNRAKTLLRLGRLDEARAAAQSLAADFPDDSEPQTFLGSLPAAE